MYPQFHEFFMLRKNFRKGLEADLRNDYQQKFRLLRWNHPEDEHLAFDEVETCLDAIVENHFHKHYSEDVFETGHRRYKDAS
jgi:hypothetical protein